MRHSAWQGRCWVSMATDFFSAQVNISTETPIDASQCGGCCPLLLHPSRLPSASEPRAGRLLWAPAGFHGPLFKLRLTPPLGEEGAAVSGWRYWGSSPAILSLEAPAQSGEATGPHPSAAGQSYPAQTRASNPPLSLSSFPKLGRARASAGEPLMPARLPALLRSAICAAHAREPTSLHLCSHLHGNITTPPHRTTVLSQRGASPALLWPALGVG